MEYKFTALFKNPRTFSLMYAAKEFYVLDAEGAVMFANQARKDGGIWYDSEEEENVQYWIPFEHILRWRFESCQ